jgi:hypothetical protein
MQFVTQPIALPLEPIPLLLQPIALPLHDGLLPLQPRDLAQQLPSEARRMKRRRNKRDNGDVIIRWLAAPSHRPRVRPA